MHPNHILWPVLAQVLLTIIMYLVLAFRRLKAKRSGNVNRQVIAVDNKAWPVDVVKVSNNVANQFESPVLFYVVCLVLYSLNGVSAVVLVLAWVFVFCRYIHAYIHVNANYVPARFGVFLVSIAALLMLVVAAAWELAT